MIKDYKIWSWGGLVGRGVFGSEHIGVAGIAKKAPEDRPAQIANEMFCADIGRALRLPIPPGIVVKRDEVPYYVSLNFFAGERLPSADPAAIATTVPLLASAAILFDLRILNYDRHDENLHFDDTTNQLSLFDHGLAMMPDERRAEVLGEHTPDHDTDLLLNHCLTGELRSFDGFDAAHNRIMALPEFCIIEALRDTIPLGIRPQDADLCAAFLLDRREQLLEIVATNRDLFINAPDPLLPEPPSAN